MIIEAFRKIFAAAADWLELHDWCQGVDARTSDGRRINWWAAKIWPPGIPEQVAACCAITAVAKVAPESWLLSVVEELKVNGVTAAWNDEPGRTKAEVIDKLRELAK